MKKLLFILAFATTSLFGQQTYNIVTHGTSIQNMVWSTYDEEYVFVENKPRHYKRVLWTITLIPNGSGYIQVDNITDNEKYGITIYLWEVRTNDKGEQYVWIDGVERKDFEKLTILVSKGPQDNTNMISAFLPESQMAIFFDNFNE